jgi:hypothetical protein
MKIDAATICAMSFRQVTIGQKVKGGEGFDRGRVFDSFH